MLYAIVGMLVVILDQLVKFWVDKNMITAGAVRDFIPGIISLVRVQNDGAAFSFLSGGGARIWFIILTGVFTVLVILALATKFISGRFGRWCLVLVTAGGLSNCLDRVLYGYVLDMFRVDLFDFAVFNVADIFITVFCIAFILYILFGGEKEREPDADEFDDEDIEEVEAVKLPAAPKGKKNRKKIVRKEDFDDDEDEEDEPRRPEPKAKPVPKLNKRPKPKNVYDDDEDEMPEPPVKAEKARFGERMKSGRNTSLFDGDKPVSKPAVDAAPVQSPPAPAAAADPFAEWEKANARLGKTAQKAENTVQAAADNLSAMFEEKPEPKPVAAEVKKPAAPPKPVVSDDFDLDSILNEFK